MFPTRIGSFVFGPTRGTSLIISGGGFGIMPSSCLYNYASHNVITIGQESTAVPHS